MEGNVTILKQYSLRRYNNLPSPVKTNYHYNL